MVMKLHTGVPGSGKTYLLIKSFIDLFCTWDKETGRYILKPEHQDKVLISNIEGLTLPHHDIETLMNDRCLQLARTRFVDTIAKHDLEEMNDVIDEYYFGFLEEKVRWFFNYNFQKQICDKYGPVIYLIEEAQRYFDAKELGRQKWVRDVHYFFEKHRHFGFSIFMDTQHSSKICKGISVLFETEIQAKPRTLSLLGEFKYNEYSDGAKINQIPIVIKPDKRIYQVYKSMSHKEDVKTKKPALKILIFVLVMIGLSFFILNYAKSNLGPKELHATTQNDSPSGSGAPPVPDPGSPAPVKKVEYTWKPLSLAVVSTGEVYVVHPIKNDIVPMPSFDLPVKKVGNNMFYQAVVTNDEKEDFFAEDENHGR